MSLVNTLMSSVPKMVVLPEPKNNLSNLQFIKFTEWFPGSVK